MKTQRAVFFFGSGISFKTGMPNVDEITDFALNTSWEWHTSQIFIPLSEDRPFNPSVNRKVPDSAKEFLRIVKGVADEYLAQHRQFYGRKANYEDLFNLCYQVHRLHNAKVPNIGTIEMAKRLRELTISLWTKHTPTIIGNDPFADLAEKACDLLHWAVAYKLRNSNPPQGLDVIKDTALSENLSSLNIFTLNHDLLIERLFKDSNVRYTDGFAREDGDVLFFDSSSFNTPEKVIMLKLHGSLNWLDYQRDGDVIARTAISKGDPSYSRDADGRYLNTTDDKPQFLSGLLVKEDLYTKGAFAEIFWQFWKILKQTKYLITCGYGFGDAGVNSRIYNWLAEDSSRRIVLLHPNIDEFRKTAPYWLTDSRFLINVPKYLQDCTLADLEPYFENN
jgi:hypothetical protein